MMNKRHNKVFDSSEPGWTKGRLELWQKWMAWFSTGQILGIEMCQLCKAAESAYR